MATTNYAWTNSAVRLTGELTNNGTFLSRASQYLKGRNNEFAVNFTGTDFSFDYISSTLTNGLQLSLDGGAWTTPTLTTGTGSWKTLAAVSGASDTTHTLIIRDNGSGGSATTIFDFTNGFAVTGASPSVAAPTGYGTVVQLSSAVGTGYVKITSGTSSSASQGNTSYSDSSFACVGFRFIATCDTIKIFAWCNGKKVRLTIDGVDQASPVTLPSTSNWEWVTIATGLDSGSAHTYRITAGSVSTIFFAVMGVGGTGISTSTLAALNLWAFYGDSITAGEIGTSNDATLSHCHLIAIANNAGCLASGRSSTTLENYGSGAANVTTQSGEARTSEITSKSPHTVVMLYGVNDAAGVGTGGWNPTAFQASAVNTLNSILAASPTKVYVLGILESTNTTAQTNRAACNAALQAAVATVGGVCRYINTDGWINPNLDCLDGLHPNATGYAKIKAAFSWSALPFRPPVQPVARPYEVPE